MGVLDHHLLPKDFTQALSNNASRYVAGSSGSKRNNERQRASRPFLCNCCCVGNKDSDNGGGKYDIEPFHLVFPRLEYMLPPLHTMKQMLYASY